MKNIGSRTFFNLHDYIKAKRGILNVAKKTRTEVIEISDTDSDSEEQGDFRGSHGSFWTRGRLLGTGCSSSVFMAKKKPVTDTNSHLPLKIAVKSTFMNNSSPLRLEKEILQQLQSSHYVIACYGDEITETISGEKVYNLLLEYCSGSSLHDHIVKFGPNGLPESEVRRYTRDLLYGLRFIHQSGYLHCDIKPMNILLQRSVGPADEDCFMAKIADFGLAKKTENMAADDMRGTGPYMSPELVRYYSLDWPADIWALGCVVLEMLTGRRVWSFGDVQEYLFTRIGYSDELPEIPLTVSPEARDFLGRCFVRSPYKRPPARLLIKHPFVSDD